MRITFKQLYRKYKIENTNKNSSLSKFSNFTIIEEMKVHDLINLAGWSCYDSFNVIHEDTGVKGIRFLVERNDKESWTWDRLKKEAEKRGIIASIGTHRYAPEIHNFSLVEDFEEEEEE